MPGTRTERQSGEFDSIYNDRQQQRVSCFERGVHRAYIGQLVKLWFVVDEQERVHWARVMKASSLKPQASSLKKPIGLLKNQQFLFIFLVKETRCFEEAIQV